MATRARAVPHAFTGGLDSRVGGREAHPGGARQGHGEFSGDGRGDDVSRDVLRDAWDDERRVMICER